MQFERLREKGMYRILAERLLDLKRGEEAIQIIHDHIETDYERWQLLPLLKANGYTDVALNIALETLTKSKSSEHAVTHTNWIREWVIMEYHERQDWDNLLKWAWVKFKEVIHREIKTYQELKEYAQEAQRWDTVFSEIISYLEGTEKFALLTSIYMEEDNAIKAWESLDNLKAKPLRRNNWHDLDIHALELEVAYATQKEFPARASAIMLTQAESLIEARGRSNYQNAAEHLYTVRTIYKQLGKEAEWETLINRIRTDNKRLPALQDELNKSKI